MRPTKHQQEHSYSAASGGAHGPQILGALCPCFTPQSNLPRTLPHIRSLAVVITVSREIQGPPSGSEHELLTITSSTTKLCTYIQQDWWRTRLLTFDSHTQWAPYYIHNCTKIVSARNMCQHALLYISIYIYIYFYITKNSNNLYPDSKVNVMAIVTKTKKLTKMSKLPIFLCMKSVPYELKTPWV